MEQNTFINGCIKVENAVASIYKNLSNKFPEKKEFWKSMFDDEKEHISFLKDVKSLALTDNIQRIDKLPPMESINKTLRLAGYIRDDISTDAIPFKDALALTLKLEESMVETYSNRVMANLLSCDDENSYNKLLMDKITHLKKIKNMMKVTQ